MVKGEALLFLAGHFFTKLSAKIFKEAACLAITRLQCPNLYVPCFYKGLFFYLSQNST
jgi:hypothetical protein